MHYWRRDDHHYKQMLQVATCHACMHEICSPVLPISPGTNKHGAMKCKWKDTMLNVPYCNGCIYIIYDIRGQVKEEGMKKEEQWQEKQRRMIGQCGWYVKCICGDVCKWCFLNDYHIRISCCAILLLSRANSSSTALGVRVSAASRRWGSVMNFGIGRCSRSSDMLMANHHDNWHY